MSDLSDFLLARYAEDEEAAQAEWDWMIKRHGPDFWTTGEGAPGNREWAYETDRDATLHVSPRRVLAECAAKRLIVELHPLDHGYCEGCGIETQSPDGCLNLRALAFPYADHPDYRRTWRP